MAETTATAPLRRARRLDLLLTGIGLAGCVDIAPFLAATAGMVRTTPGRAAGSMLGLAVWAGLTSLAIAGARGADSPALRRSTLACAAFAAVGGVGLTVAHAAGHVGGWRPARSGVLGVVALGVALAARGAPGR